MQADIRKIHADVILICKRLVQLQLIFCMHLACDDAFIILFCVRVANYVLFFCD